MNNIEHARLQGRLEGLKEASELTKIIAFGKTDYDKVLNRIRKLSIELQGSTVYDADRRFRA